MSFNLGNNDRSPAFGGSISSNKSNNNRGGDMVLTPDHPAWSRVGEQQRQQQQQQPIQDPSAPYTGGRATAGANNLGPFRAGPDSDSYLPPDAAPQGARFDPIMPDNVQGLPHRGHSSQQRESSSGLGQASGEPDFDDLLPPQ
ncbi:hypothetical protein BX616_010295 [Lobosporangium transversale]|uniref:Uncharacterized protein n=1 Tax=Lobosporangium transversale TaxID=64571 RepID=A0A1Y2H5K0_9FUNG|nr:hypothetical protein BCR41DRAFT_344377 [Lobosporangium transversale]KAF9918086.1 hypothetical protein BX616_010295 [Lobosporangium transversale]ORZ28983.1 hypothetical protein BCR41DRAFT_344377 [Lobosporangium transversale]|eukprot:XP_021886656.1 hypothetical protein BCR41DRAFT_344377 [Lobosporangium transversale]